GSLDIAAKKRHSSQVHVGVIGWPTLWQRLGRMGSIMARKAASQRKAKADLARRRGRGKAAAARPQRRRLAPAPRAKNPLLEPWTAAFGLPPFARLSSRHFL